VSPSGQNAALDCLPPKETVTGKHCPGKGGQEKEGCKNDGAIEVRSKTA
jgi:hypothetical protein